MQGWGDSSLTPTGQQHAMRHGQILKREGIDLIFASNLKRVRETVEGIQATCDAEVTFFEDLRERKMGHWEGKKADDIERLYPDAWEIWRSGDEEYAPPAGESINDMKVRVSRVLKRLDSIQTDRIAFVTHGITTRVLLDLLYGLSEEQKQRLRIPHHVIHRVDRRSSPAVVGHIQHDQPFTEGVFLSHY